MNIEKEKKTCFVIMPFSGTSTIHTEIYWKQHYEKVLKPLIDSNNFVAYRASPIRYDLVTQIIKDLITADVVVADVTDENPNVYWELGIRHSFKNGTIIISQGDEINKQLPFDTGRQGTLFYRVKQNENLTSDVDFITNFNIALKDCINTPDRFDSFVLQTISGRGSVYEIIQKTEILRKLDSLLDEFKYNLSIIDQIFEQCNLNFQHRLNKREKEIKMTTLKLRAVCLENILVNRYIKANSDFYNAAVDCYDECIAYNGQLSTWHSTVNTQQRDEYLSRNYPDIKKNFNEITQIIRQEINRISSVL